MSKKGYISRYLLIVKRLKSRPYASFEDLQAYLENQMEYLQMQDDTLDIAFSKRTLQRDLREIRNLFGIDIQFSRSEKGYHLVQSEAENMNFQRMMEAFDMFNSLNLSRDLSPYIHLQKRRPQGTENLYGLLHAVKQHRKISFTYRKFWDDKSSQRTVEPYGLKEFKNRWYLLAKDLKDGHIKSFGLDRLSDLEISADKFQYPKDYNIEETYRYCFGIVGPDAGQKPEEIILSFKPFQGKYLKTLPLHETQQVLVDNEDELRVKLKLYITYDLKMELLSYGDSMRVVEPSSLAEAIKQEHLNASKATSKRKFNA